MQICEQEYYVGRGIQDRDGWPKGDSKVEVSYRPAAEANLSLIQRVRRAGTPAAKNPEHIRGLDPIGFSPVPQLS